MSDAFVACVCHGGLTRVSSLLHLFGFLGPGKNSINKPCFQKWQKVVKYRKIKLKSAVIQKPKLCFSDEAGTSTLFKLDVYSHSNIKTTTKKKT